MYPESVGSLIATLSIQFLTVRMLSIIHFFKIWILIQIFKNSSLIFETKIPIFDGDWKWKIDKAKLYLDVRFFSRKWFGQNSNFRCLIRMLINQTWLRDRAKSFQSHFWILLPVYYHAPGSYESTRTKSFRKFEQKLGQNQSQS